MSNKIPVFKVAGKSIGFTFGNLLTLIRIGWFPIALVLTSQYALNSLIIPETPDDFEALGSGFLIYTFGFGLLGGLALAIFAVAVHRLVLKQDDTPRGWIYFRFTGQEFRYFVAPFFIYLIVGTVIGALTAALLLAFGPPDIPSAPAIDPANPNIMEVMPMGLFAALVIIYVLLIFFLMRFLLVLPIIVAERKMGFIRSWKLMKGNIWRMIWANLIMATALGVIMLGIGYAATLIIEVLSLPSPLIALAEYLQNVTDQNGVIPIELLLVAIGLMSLIFTPAGLALLSYSYMELKEATDE